MDTPLISIIIPVYNNIVDLPQCLDSVLNQTFNQWEAICIDDGSSDGSENMLDDYAKRDSRFKVIHKKNGGAADARNTGLDNASAPYITMVDADDYIENTTLETIYSAMVESDCDIVLFNINRVQNNGRIKQAHCKLLPGSQPAKPSHFFSAFSPAPYAKLYKKNIIEQHHLRFPKGVVIGEDCLFVASYWLYTKNTNYVNKNLYYYKDTETSVIKKFREGKLASNIYEETISLPFKIYLSVKHNSENVHSVYEWYKSLLKVHLVEQSWVIRDICKHRKNKTSLHILANKNYKIIASEISRLDVFKIKIQYYVSWNRGRIMRIAGKIKRMICTLLLKKQ